MIPDHSCRYWQISGPNGLLAGGFLPLIPLVPPPIAEHSRAARFLQSEWAKRGVCKWKPESLIAFSWRWQPSTFFWIPLICSSPHARGWIPGSGDLRSCLSQETYINFFHVMFCTLCWWISVINKRRKKIKESLLRSNTEQYIPTLKKQIIRMIVTLI